MTLAEYLCRHRISRRRFAQLMGISSQGVDYIVCFNSCNAKNAGKIAGLTHCQVILHDGRKTRVDHGRWKRIVRAREHGVTSAALAERFGFKDANSFRASLFGARRRQEEAN